MSKFTKELKDLLIHNEHDFYGKGHVFISYGAGTTGRGGRSAYWRVYRTGYKTDPDSHFKDHDNKTFSVWGRGSLKEIRAERLEEAKRWSEEKYGSVAEWKKDPYGGWSEATYVKARTKALKAALKALPFRTGDLVLVGGEGEIRTIYGYNGDGKIMLEGDPYGYRAITYSPSELTKATDARS